MQEGIFDWIRWGPEQLQGYVPHNANLSLNSLCMFSLKWNPRKREANSTGGNRNCRWIEKLRGSS